MPAVYQKSGYLFESFRIFHNADATKREIPYHYHDFHKILLFLSGNVSYIMEGRQFVLEPGDIVLVRAGVIHRPVIHDNSLYERIIFYIDPGFFSEEAYRELDLFSSPAGSEESAALLRLTGAGARLMEELVPQIRYAVHDTGYASDLLRRVKLMELLILLSRAIRSQETMLPADVTSNPYITAALDYIHEHLEEESLNIDEIADAAALGRSYLMHLFKSQIGYTIGQYITEKRLYLAGTLMKNGVPVTQACYRSGFRNYAAFYYAYQQKFGAAPSQKRSRSQRVEGE